MVPLMVISLPAGVLADRLSKRSVIVAMKVFELVLMLAGDGRAVRSSRDGGPLAMGVLGLLGVQTAFFGPAKYGILPEILPHERLSAGNGLLEMASNLAILSGIVAGAGSSRRPRRSTCRSGWAGVLLAALCRLRPARRLDDPAGQGRAGRGGAGHHGADRLEVDPGRSRAAAGAHRPDPRLDDRHPGARADPALCVEDPAPLGVGGGLAAGRAGDRHRRRLPAGGQALGRRRWNMACCRWAPSASPSARWPSP